MVVNVKFLPSLTIACGGTNVGEKLQPNQISNPGIIMVCT
jgi:hypothetical protein